MKINEKSKLVLFFLMLFFGLNSATGQDEFRGFSVTPAIGVYYALAPDDAGFLASIQISRIRDNRIYSVDYIALGEFTLLDPIPGNVYNQIGIMLGRSTRHDFFRFHYHVGVAPTFGKMYSENNNGNSQSNDYHYYTTDKFFTIGLAGKLGATLLISKNIAVYAGVRTNLNFKRSLVFPEVGLEIGKLRD